MPENTYQQIKLNIIIALSVWIVWLSTLGVSEAFFYLQKNWQIAVTMIFGSLVAGATSEGGGAVAFPVFTKLLHIPPQEAKIFALAIQSIGMTSASLFIIIMRVPVEWRVIFWASLGGIVGMLIGACILAPIFIPSVTKVTFTLLVGSFAIALLAMNQGVSGRHLKLPADNYRERTILVIAGVIGGMFSGLVGSGIDILMFSVIVLLFRICEKVATPTSVILMAINSLIGFALHLFVLGGFSETVRGYWLAAIPVVVVGAPLGALICANLARQLIVNILLSLILLEVVTTMLIIPLDRTILLYSIVGLISFSSTYYWMYQNKTYEVVTTV